ncbi:MAG: phosphotriesterase [Eubacteriales bacterium]|nr:phosphotriesterase [Eubacteriales bacterium]
MSERKIITVAGEITPQETGYFQCHEHLMIAPGQSSLVNEDLCIDDAKKSLEEVKRYHQAGGFGLVDAQPVGCGRMAEELKKISEESGVQIVASTGFHKMLFYPEGHWVFTKKEEWLTELFLLELREGMYQDGDKGLPVQKTTYRAGQIKTAMEKAEMNAQYQKMFLSAANAARESGAPIMVHVENGQNPMAYFTLLVKEGISANQMIFCHLDRASSDIGVHKELASAGVFIEYDTIGREKYHSDEVELSIFESMIEAGFEDQLLFSLDTTRRRLISYGGGVGLDYILCTFRQKMQQHGMGDGLFRKIAVQNPWNALCWKNKK